MADTTRRTLEFRSGSPRSTREMTTAVAWITAREGGFEGDNVGPEIRRLLAAEGFKIDQQSTARTMARLEEMGVAVRSVHGRYHRLFVMDPDVDIPEPDFIKAKRLRDAQQQPATNGAAPEQPRRPPVPTRHVDPPWMADLTATLANWWDENPAEARGWGVTAPQPKHPAKFSEPIIARLRVLVQAERRRVLGRVHDGPLVVLDPFAGVGRVHRLAKRTGPGQIRTVGVEIEEEWAACHRDTIHADAFEWMTDRGRYGSTTSDPWGGSPAGLVDVIATSPTYGNRFSDNHNAQDGSTRRSYTHDLGHKLHPNNSGQIPWGPKYWAFHAEAYQLMLRVLRPGGLLLLNVSDFYRRRQLVHATEWHRGAAMGAGFVHAGRDALVATDRLQGVGVTAATATDDGPAATDARASHETILRLRRPEGT